jgi:2-(3-amino-3-carboxypropyl)histidine synthase
MKNYNFSVKKILEKIDEINANVIGLQFPEGLKVYATDITKLIEESRNVTVIIAGDSCYGACDVSDVQMKGIVDLLIHFGHTPLPINNEIPVLFIGAFSRIKVLETVKKALSFLIKDKKIGLVTTTQHLHQINDIKLFLEKNKKEVLLNEGIGTKKGQVLGCNFSSIKNLDADAFLFVGSGNFHALGIKLFTEKKVVIADPYMNEARDINEFADRILKIRFARITKAKAANNFGIIVSAKKGQFRLELAKSLKNMIHKHQKQAFIILMDNISPDLLLPFRDIEVFIITACPRIAIDDAQTYNKILLTPQEVQIVLETRSWEDYKLDEIEYSDEKIEK